MNLINHIEQKLHSPSSLQNALSIMRFKQKKIVFTNGCFDLVHLGHVDYLAKAAALGDVLVIGLNSDSSIKKIKGPERPVMNEHARRMLLASFEFVDAVVLFDEDTPYELIKLVQPDILVKGSDYKPEDVVGYDIVSAKGGSIMTIDFVEGYSTSSIISKLRS